MTSTRLTDSKRMHLRRLIMADVPDGAEVARKQACKLVLDESLKHLPPELRKISEGARQFLRTTSISVRSPNTNGPHVFYATVYGTATWGAMCKRAGFSTKLNRLLGQHGHLKGERRKLDDAVRGALSAYSTVASLVKAYPEWASHAAKLGVVATPVAAPARDEALVDKLTKARPRKSK